MTSYELWLKDPVGHLYRMFRYGPALYRASRALGGTRWEALKLVVWP
jgi:hypothetical protein